MCSNAEKILQLECGPMPNVMAAQRGVAPSVERCWSNRENNEAKTRNQLKFVGCPKLANQS